MSNFPSVFGMASRGRHHIQSLRFLPMTSPADSPRTCKDLALRVPHRVSLQSSAPEETQSFLSSLFGSVTVKPTGTERFDFEATMVVCEGVCFGTAHSRSGIEMMFNEPFDGYGMSLLSEGVLSVDTAALGQLVSPTNSGVIVDLLGVSEATFVPRTGLQQIVVDSDALHRHIALLTERPLRQRVKFAPHFDRESGAARLLLAVVQAIMNGTRGPAPLLAAPTAVASLKSSILSVFVENMPHNYSDLLGRRVPLPAPGSVKRAIDFMHARLTEPLHLEHIARAAQTSPRSLQVAFRKFCGMTPMEYLKRLRLEGARSELLEASSGSRVADVAYRWGFAHHGMFSASYAKAFGESPSATLRRGSRR
jgi:AraC-like DNA-binding protein